MYSRLFIQCILLINTCYYRTHSNQSSGVGAWQQVVLVCTIKKKIIILKSHFMMNLGTRHVYPGKLLLEYGERGR